MSNQQQNTIFPGKGISVIEISQPSNLYSKNPYTDKTGKTESSPSTGVFREVVIFVRTCVFKFVGNTMFYSWTV